MLSPGGRPSLGLLMHTGGDPAVGPTAPWNVPSPELMGLTLSLPSSFHPPSKNPFRRRVHPTPGLLLQPAPPEPDTQLGTSGPLAPQHP